MARLNIERACVLCGRTYHPNSKATARPPQRYCSADCSNRCPTRAEESRQRALGNDNWKRRVLSVESRKKISDTSRGNTYCLGYTHTPEAREKIRQARLRQKLPARDTQIELLLEHEFRKRRLVFKTHTTMFGRFQPDFVFEGVKLIVQADGDYWHAMPKHFASDCEFNARAASQGWTVIRFSEAVIKTKAAVCAKTVARFVRAHA